MTLNEHELRAINQCGFRDHHEVAFYIRLLGNERLIDSHCSADNLLMGGTITINGYRYCDMMNPQIQTDSLPTPP